jgi:hypothetical protein
LSNASPPRNSSSSDPHLLSAGAPHESTSPASNLDRASARTLVLCLTFLRMQHGGAIQTLRCAAPCPFSLPPAIPSPLTPTANSQTINNGSSRYKSHNPPGRLPSSRCI